MTVDLEKFKEKIKGSPLLNLSDEDLQTILDTLSELSGVIFDMYQKTKDLSKESVKSNVSTSEK